MSVVHVSVITSVKIIKIKVVFNNTTELLKNNKYLQKVARKISSRNKKGHNIKKKLQWTDADEGKKIETV